MCNVSDHTLNACHKYEFLGVGFWTAGQRRYPLNPQSPFVWRVQTAESSDKAYEIGGYTNWYPGEPNNDGAGSIEACMTLWSGHSYKWHDRSCNIQQCAVCELDI